MFARLPGGGRNSQQWELFHRSVVTSYRCDVALTTVTATSELNVYRAQKLAMASRRQSRPPYNNEVELFVAQHKRQAENLVISEFPRRVDELDKLMHTEQFSAETVVRLLQDARRVRGT